MERAVSMSFSDLTARRVRRCGFGFAVVFSFLYRMGAGLRRANGASTDESGGDRAHGLLPAMRPSIAGSAFDFLAAWPLLTSAAARTLLSSVAARALLSSIAIPRPLPHSGAALG